LHRKNKTEADDERKKGTFTCKGKLPPSCYLPCPLWRRTTTYQNIRCNAMVSSNHSSVPSTTPVPFPSVASRSPPSPLQALLLCACDLLWQPAGRFTKGFSGSRPRHAPIHAAQAQTRPLKTGKRAHANRCFLQRVGSTAVAQPNLTELPRKG
jgi:hypothetical protein